MKFDKLKLAYLKADSKDGYVSFTPTTLPNKARATHLVPPTPSPDESIINLESPSYHVSATTSPSSLFEQGFTLGDVPVVPNRLYRLIMSHKFIAAPSTLSQLSCRYTLTSKNWNHSSHTYVTPSFPYLDAMIVIPQYVKSVDVTCWIRNPQYGQFELRVFPSECEWSPICEQPLNSSRPTRIHPRLSACPFTNIASHIYLVHLPSTPLLHTFRLKQHLLGPGSGIDSTDPSLSVMFLNMNQIKPNSSSSSFDRLSSHHPEVCSSCFYHASNEILRGGLTGTEQQHQQYHKKMISPQSKYDLMRVSLEHAISKSFDSVLILRDDILLHHNWKELINEHGPPPPNWSIILLGAYHPSDIHHANIQKWLKPFYLVPSSINQTDSTFAMLIRGRNVYAHMLKLLQDPTTFETNLFSTYKDSSYVWYHNLVVAHPQHSPNTTPPSLHLLNRDKHHLLYWNTHSVYTIPQDIHNTTSSCHLSNLPITPMNLVRSTCIHIFLPCYNVEDLKRFFPKVWESLLKQSYTSWRLYIFYVSSSDTVPITFESNTLSGSNNNTINATQIHQLGKIQWIRVTDPAQMREHVINKLTHLPPLDWITFQSPYLCSISNRLDYQIRQWLMVSDTRPFIVGNQVLISQEQTCLSKLDICPFSIFNDVTQMQSLFAPTLSNSTPKTYIDFANYLNLIRTSAASYMTIIALPRILLYQPKNV